MTDIKEISICIVLYNKKIQECKSYLSLKELSLPKNSSIAIFNNGPLIIEDDLPSNYVIHNVIVNASLSKIYNSFFKNYKSKKYILLDDDSTLNQSYIDQCLSSNSDITLPIILCKNKKEYPILLNNKIQSITSGICISNDFLNSHQEKNKIFDERFDLYGIDTYFFKRLYFKDVSFNIINSNLNHELSHLTNNKTAFREKEVFLANSAALLKYFDAKLLFTVIYWFLKYLFRIEFKICLSSIFSIILMRVIRLDKY